MKANQPMEWKHIILFNIFRQGTSCWK